MDNKYKGTSKEADMSLARPYVNNQTFTKMYNLSSALAHGTIFPELVSPYAPCDSMRDIAFIEKTNTIGEGCNSCQ